MKMKSYRKKEKFLVLMAVVVLLELLFTGCPGGTTDTPTSNPCPGSPGCSCNGSGCTHDDCHCTPPATTTKPFTFNGSKTAIKPFDVPGTSPVSQKDVKLNGTTVSIRATVNNLIIIDADGYGWQNGGSISSGGTITGLTTPVAVFKSDGKGWFTPGTPTTVPGGGSPKEISPISISSVTNSKISNVSGLSSGAYKINAIVRSSTRFNGDDVPDLNLHAHFKTVNTIRIYPDAEVP